MIRANAAEWSTVLLLLIASEASAQQQIQEPVQATCPVMVGNPVDPDIYVDYKGKIVRFCCESCKAAFLEEPGKYLHRLPQFGGGPEAGDERGRGFSTGKLAKPLGLATLSLLVLAAVLGWQVRRKPRLLLRWHRRLAVAVVVFALAHAVLVAFFH